MEAENMMHPEQQMGRFFGGVSFFVAIACVGISVIVGGGISSAGWLIAAIGWGLTGSGSLAIGRERAKR
jgi:hypothetical protein